MLAGKVCNNARRQTYPAPAGAARDKKTTRSGYERTPR
jgi:hypothetical protein